MAGFLKCWLLTFFFSVCCLYGGAESGQSGWGTWGPWSKCSKSCGGGIQTRVRSWQYGADTPSPRPFTMTDAVGCYDWKPCPVSTGKQHGRQEVPTDTASHPGEEQTRQKTTVKKTTQKTAKKTAEMLKMPEKTPLEKTVKQPVKQTEKQREKAEEPRQESSSGQDSVDRSLSSGQQRTADPRHVFRQQPDSQPRLRGGEDQGGCAEVDSSGGGFGAGTCPVQPSAERIIHFRITLPGSGNAAA